jgi:hypothetical protein
VNKEEALITARRLIKEAVAVATEAGIDPASIVEPHCRKTPAPEDNGGHLASPELRWHGVPVTIDAATADLFEMSKPRKAGCNVFTVAKLGRARCGEAFG